MSQVVSVSIEEELKKNPELKESDIESLKEWLRKEPHLPRVTDSTLALFLHRNYYNVESTKVNIEHYYTLRTHLPDFFSNRDILSCKELRHVFKVISITPLKQLTKDGYQIVLIKLIDYDPSNFVYNQYVRLILTVFDLLVYRQGTMNGYIVVLDAQEVTLGHAVRVNPSGAKKYLTYVQSGLPVRVKGIHMVNLNHGMEAVLKVLRPFMGKDFQDALHLHHGMKSLEKFVPIEALPKELGGKAGPLMKLHENNIKELEEYRNWFLEEESRSQVDESKRLGKAKTAQDFFGTEGNFKKLDEF